MSAEQRRSAASKASAASGQPRVQQPQIGQPRVSANQLSSKPVSATLSKPSKEKASPAPVPTIQDNFKQKLSELKAATVQMINKPPTDEDKELPMEIDEIKMEMKSPYKRPTQALDQEMSYEPNNIDIPKGIEINLPAHIRQQINQKLDENIAIMKYDIQGKISNIQLDMIR